MLRWPPWGSSKSTMSRNWVLLHHVAVFCVDYSFICWCGVLLGAVGIPKRAPIDSNILKLLIPIAVCHALGHVTSNVSFAVVAVSFTHTIKALSHSSMLLLLNSYMDNRYL